MGESGRGVKIKKKEKVLKSNQLLTYSLQDGKSGQMETAALRSIRIPHIHAAQLKSIGDCKLCPSSHLAKKFCVMELSPTMATQL